MRSDQKYPVVEKRPSPGSCPSCGDTQLRTYNVIAEVGWQTVVKCQRCLHSVERRPWSRLGGIELLIDRVPT